MISEYLRPKTLDEALKALSQPEKQALPLAGGTAIRRFARETATLVDLQALGLDQIANRGNYLEVGAMVRLQSLLDHPRIQDGLKRALVHEATFNLRQAATVAGTLVTADGRSPFAAACLALDASLVLEPGSEQVDFGDLLAFRPERLAQRLITAVRLPLNASLAYEYVARTPADLPIVGTAVARWPAGRTRVALCGWGQAPRLVMDGPESAGAEIAAREACNQAADEWASAEYRQEVAGILVRRCIEGF